MRALKKFIGFSGILILSFLLPERFTEATTTAPTTRAVGAKTSYWLGSLRKNQALSLQYPNEYCLEDGFLYKGTSDRMFGWNLQAVSTQAKSLKKDRLYLLQGKLHNNLNQILKKKSPCPSKYGKKRVTQVSKQLLALETGFSLGHSSSQRMRYIPYLKYTHAKPFHQFQTKQIGQKWHVSFTNPTPYVLSNLHIIMAFHSKKKHHKHAHHPKAPPHRTHIFSKVQPKQTITAIFPMTQKDEQLEITVSSHSKQSKIYFSKFISPQKQSSSQPTEPSQIPTSQPSTQKNN